MTDQCLMLYYLSLVHFHLLGLTRPVIQIFTNLDLLGLIFILN